MFPAMCTQPPCRNIEVKAPSYQGRWGTSEAGSAHGPSSEHG